MKYKINKYPDGSSYVDVSEMGSEIYGWIPFRINSYEDLWHLTQLCDAIGDITEPSIIIPNLLDAQADRRFNDKHSFGAKLVLDHLKMLSDNYGVYFRIFHPHNPEVVESILGRNVEVQDNRTFIYEVIADLQFEVYDLDPIKTQSSLTILSPDAGSYKWVNKTMDNLEWEGEVLSASKVRTYEDNETKLKQQLPTNDFGGKDVLIVDDISIGGGTFKGLSKLLKEANCGKLYLAVSHMTVQDLGSDPVTNYFDKVYTTNSKFDDYFKNNPDTILPSRGLRMDNLEIIKMFDI